MAALTAHALGAERVLLGGVPLLHSHAPSNPSVVVRVLVRAGASREASDEQGLASMVGRMLRQGSERMTRDALAEELDGMGAGLSVDVGYALVAVSMKCLADDVERACELLAEVLSRPTFPADQWERVRGQALTDLREMEDSTRVAAEKAWRELAYPPAHRYHRLTSGTVQTLTRFSRDDLERFYQTWFGANQATLVVVGDVSLARSTETLEKVLGKWAAANPGPFTADLPTTAPPETGRRDVTLEGKTQADIVLGTTTLARTDPDYYALAFANHVLGRLYFMGRFGARVRDEQGLAYYAYSELQGGFGSGGWTVRAGVNPRGLDEALASIRAELQHFLDDGPTEAEQADGIASLIGSLPRQLESNEGVAAVLSEIELYGLGLDYLERYEAIVRGLSREKVLAAARRWIQPDHVVTAVAGPAA